MTKFIQKLIGTGAIIILAGLSILISLTVKALNAIGVDISDVFTCNVTVNDSYAQEVARLKQTITLNGVLMREKEAVSQVLEHQLERVGEILAEAENPDDPRDDIERYSETLTTLENYLNEIRRHK